VLGLANTLNSAAKNIQGVLVNAASAAIASAPGLNLQCGSVGLYELYQQDGLRQWLGRHRKAANRCSPTWRVAKTLIDRSLTLSKSYSWRDQMGKSQTGNDSVDVLQAMNIVDSKGGDGGVPWVGGQNAGGRDQPPILVVSDVVKAGYNIEQGRDPTGNDQGQPDTRVAQVWKSPAEAVDYARAVLGDVKIETKNNADREAQPGHGLGPKIEQDRQDGLAALSKLVNGNAAPSPDELAKVSAPGTQLNRDVVETIRRFQPQERAVVVGKLAAERATAANVERAMMLRRLLFCQIRFMG
jgi:integrating conjugative element protein (TIGR03755 family)